MHQTPSERITELLAQAEQATDPDTAAEYRARAHELEDAEAEGETTR